MLFLPAVIVLVVAKQDWLKTIAGIVLFVGFIVSIEIWPLYLIALAITYAIVAGIAALVRAIIRTKQKNKIKTDTFDTYNTYKPKSQTTNPYPQSRPKPKTRQEFLNSLDPYNTHKPSSQTATSHPQPKSSSKPAPRWYYKEFLKKYNPR